jgi:hypothetical protein
MSKFNFGDKVKILEDNGSHARYDLVGCTGKVVSPGPYPSAGNKNTRIKLDTIPDAWHSEHVSVPNELLEKALPNGFFVGDRIYMLDSAFRKKSEVGIVCARPDYAVSSESADEVWAHWTGNSRATWINVSKVDLVTDKENTVPVVEEEVKLYHTFKVNDGGETFSKIDDFNKTESDLHNMLFRDCGEGKYFYKAKNEPDGKFITIKKSEQPFEVVNGI